MKFLKFAGVYLAFALFIFLLVVGWNFKEFSTVFDNSEGLTEGQELVEKTFSLGGLAELISEKPEFFSAYSSELRSGNENLSIKGDVPRPLVSLSTIFLLIHAYDQSVHNPDFLNQPVSLDSISRFFIPNNYRSIQEQTVKDLTQIQKKKKTLQLRDLLPVLAKYNSRSVYDYLVFKWGSEAVLSTAATFGFIESFTLLPFSGIAIQLQPDLQQEPFESIFSRYEQADSAFHNAVWLSTHAYIYNNSFREQVIQTFTEKESGLTFLQEKQSFGLYPKATPKAIVTLVRSVLTHPNWPDSTKNEWRKLLSWPMSDRSINHWFSYYGGLFESKMGLLTGLDIAVPKERGDTLIQAVLFDRIPIALWFHMSSKFINLDYQRRISWDAELRSRSLNNKVVKTSSNP